MSNPLLTGLESPQTSLNNSNVNNIINLLKVAKNPSQALVQMAQSNPQLNEVLNMCNGKNPRDVFYEECRKRGIDPQQIFNQLNN